MTIFAYRMSERVSERMCCAYGVRRTTCAYKCGVVYSPMVFCSHTIDIGISIFNSILFVLCFDVCLSLSLMWARDFHSIYCYHVKLLNTQYICTQWQQHQQQQQQRQWQRQAKIIHGIRRFFSFIRVNWINAYSSWLFALDLFCRLALYVWGVLVCAPFSNSIYALSCIFHFCPHMCGAGRERGRGGCTIIVCI